jgi:hypothetical protein
MVREKIANLLHSIADSVGGINFQADRETRKLADEALARISQKTDVAMARAAEEADRRDKMGLLDAKAPEWWRACYYMQQGYRVTFDQNNAQDHWRGGKPHHENAECPVCKKPLLLFWDINCNDPRFRVGMPELFGNLERLPLYFCCRRPEPTCYRIISQDSIQTFRPPLQGGEESPFASYPDSFERKSIRLEPIPRDVENLLILANEFHFDWLNEQERSSFSNYFGTDIENIWDIHLSQFGGVPVLTQGHREVDCPNPACLTHKMGHPLLRDKKHYQMKELAVIDVDAGFEMDSGYSQIAFHICWKCLSIHAEYRCS